MESLLSPLPTELTAGITQPASDRLGNISLDEFCRRVSQDAGVSDAGQVRAHMRGLFTVLSDAAGADRLQAALTYLRPEYKALLPAGPTMT